MAQKLGARVPLRREHMFALKDMSENEDMGTEGWKIVKKGRERKRK